MPSYYFFFKDFAIEKVEMYSNFNRLYDVYIRKQRKKL
jgi:hypothetical protein